MTEPTPKLSNIEIRNLISMRVFRYTCLICAILLTFRCINLFVRNKDVAEIKFFEYHEDEDNIYPSITFCHRHPFIEKALKKYDQNLSINSYKAFLKGDCRTYSNESTTCGKYDDEVRWKRSWLDIDYDNVTLHVKDFINRFIINFFTNNEEVNTNDNSISYIIKNDSLVPDIGTIDKEYENLDQLNFYISARHPYYKCFTFDVPFIQGKFIHNFELDINASIFENGIIHPDTSSGQYFVTFGYPNQLIRSSVRNKVVMKRPNFSTTCFLQDTLIGSLEVLRRRDKSSQRCYDNWKNHDQHVLQDISKKVGCTPKHWMIPSDVEYCSTYEQYSEITFEFNHLNKPIPPCKSIERISQTTYETDLGNKCAFFYPYFGMLMLKIDYHKETMYKEIQLVRAYTLENLVGNAG